MTNTTTGSDEYNIVLEFVAWKQQDENIRNQILELDKEQLATLKKLLPILKNPEKAAKLSTWIDDSLLTL